SLRIFKSSKRARRGVVLGGSTTGIDTLLARASSAGCSRKETTPLCEAAAYPNTVSTLAISMPYQSDGSNGPDFSTWSFQTLSNFGSISAADLEGCQTGTRKGCHRSARRLCPP